MELEERAEAARAAAEALEAEAAQPPSAPTVVIATEDEGPQEMEGVESEEHEPPSEDHATEDQTRVLTIIRGEEVDVTQLGIDPEYLAALPEEFREEVIAQTVSTRRSQAREEAAASGEQTEVFQEFLDALPEELRLEIIQQERQENRRRHREEVRRQAQASGEEQIAVDMDPASILLTFPPRLRQEVLIEQGEELLDQLPPEMAAQARALHQQQQQNTHSLARGSNIPVPGGVIRYVNSGGSLKPSGAQTAKAQRRTVVQMLDKAGVATLLRLMFIAQQGSIRGHLFNVFSDA